MRIVFGSPRFDGLGPPSLSDANVYGLPAFAVLLIDRLNVVPLSKRRLPPVRLSVEPAAALPDWVI